MNTFDRITALLEYWNTEPGPVIRVHHYNMTDLLDRLDEAAGINTEWDDNHSCRYRKHGWDCKGDHNNRRYVGARVALHEKHLALHEKHLALKRSYTIQWGCGHDNMGVWRDKILTCSVCANVIDRRYFHLGREAEAA